MDIVSDNQSICTDCLQWLANGTLPENEQESVDFLERINNASRNDETLGHEWVAGDEEYGFSWNPCDCCESQLGGNRYQAIILQGG